MTLHATVEPDPTIWIRIPQRWGEPWRYDVWWADEIARSRWEESGLPYEKLDLDRTSAVLARAALHWGPGSVQAEHGVDPTMEIQAWLYLPNPDSIPMPVRVMVISEAVLRAEPITIEELVQVEDPEAITAVEVLRFDHPNLGAGLRTYRHRDDYGEGDHHAGEFVALKYAFPVPGQGAIVYVNIACPDLKLIYQAQDDIDELVRTIHVEHRPDLSTADAADAHATFKSIGERVEPAVQLMTGVRVIPSFDNPAWFFVPLDWGPPESNPRAWAATLASQIWIISGLRHNQTDVELTIAQLEKCAELFGPGRTHAEHQLDPEMEIFTLLHMPDPTLPPLVARLMVFADLPVSLEELVKDSGSELSDLVQIAEFTTSHLGKGRRSLRRVHRRTEAGQRVYDHTAARYAVDVPGHRLIAYVSASHLNAERLESARRDLDFLAMALCTEPAPERSAAGTAPSTPRSRPTELVSVVIEADPSVWFRPPDRWTSTVPDAQAWAEAVAAEVWSKSGVTVEAETNAGLIRVLTAWGDLIGFEGALGDRHDGTPRPVEALVHIPDPRVPPVLTLLDVISGESIEKAGDTLESLVAANNPEAVAPVTLEEFTGSHFGPGLRSRALVARTTDSGEPAVPDCQVTYALPVPDRTDVIVVQVTEREHRIDAMRDDLESLLGRLRWGVRRLPPEAQPARTATPAIVEPEAMLRMLSAGEELALAHQRSLPAEPEPANSSWFGAWGRQLKRWSRKQ